MQASTRNCCCEECISAPRLLRPARQGGHYLEAAAYAVGRDGQASIASVSTSTKNCPCMRVDIGSLYAPQVHVNEFLRAAEGCARQPAKVCGSRLRQTSTHRAAVRVASYGGGSGSSGCTRGRRADGSILNSCALRRRLSLRRECKLQRSSGGVSLRTAPVAWSVRGGCKSSALALHMLRHVNLCVQSECGLVVGAGAFVTSFPETEIASIATDWCPTIRDCIHPKQNNIDGASDRKQATRCTASIAHPRL